MDSLIWKIVGIAGLIFGIVSVYFAWRRHWIEKRGLFTRKKLKEHVLALRGDRTLRSNRITFNFAMLKYCLHFIESQPHYTINFLALYFQFNEGAKQSLVPTESEIKEEDTNPIAKALEQERLIDKTGPSEPAPVYTSVQLTEEGRKTYQFLIGEKDRTLEKWMRKYFKK